MPTLTIDLSEAEYRAALALPPAELRRVLADGVNRYATAPNVPPLSRGVVTPTVADPEAVARLRAQALASAGITRALFEQWDSAPDSGDEPDPEELRVALEANGRMRLRTVTMETD